MACGAHCLGEAPQVFRSARVPDEHQRGEPALKQVFRGAHTFRFFIRNDARCTNVGNPAELNHRHAGRHCRLNKVTAARGELADDAVGFEIAELSGERAKLVAFPMLDQPVLLARAA